MWKKSKPINHPLLGGDVVDPKKPFPQRKPEKVMSGRELLNKAVTGSPKPKNEQDLRREEWDRIMKNVKRT